MDINEVFDIYFYLLNMFTQFVLKPSKSGND